MIEFCCDLCGKQGKGRDAPAGLIDSRWWGRSSCYDLANVTSTHRIFDLVTVAHEIASLHRTRDARSGVRVYVIHALVPPEFDDVGTTLALGLGLCILSGFSNDWNTLDWRAVQEFSCGEFLRQCICFSSSPVGRPTGSCVAKPFRRLHSAYPQGRRLARHDRRGKEERTKDEVDSSTDGQRTSSA